MKLRQHGCGKPTIHRYLADEPSESAQQIVDLSIVRKELPGMF
jgi:hypothetical protein